MQLGCADFHAKTQPELDCTSTLPELTEEQILAWADAYHAKHGSWPSCEGGALDMAPEESWKNINAAMHQGLRGLKAGSSLAGLLGRDRGYRYNHNAPNLTIKRILGWADKHHARVGKWPTRESGPIVDAPGESWASIAAALEQGIRGLPKGSLAELLRRHRGRRNKAKLPRLTEEKILRWADAFHQRTGKWPTRSSGLVPRAGDTWNAINLALYIGLRGLPGGSSLAKLLDRERRKE